MACARFSFKIVSLSKSVERKNGAEGSRVETGSLCWGCPSFDLLTLDRFNHVRRFFGLRSFDSGKTSGLGTSTNFI